MFSSLTILARLAFKQFFSTQQQLNSDDWAIVAVVPIGVTSIALSIFGLTRNGLGVDLWGLQLQQLVNFGHYFYIEQMLYIILMTLLKIVLTLFYLNIFQGCGIRILLWMTMAVHALVGLSFTISIVFQCIPIAYQWEKYEISEAHSTSGYCLDVNATGWAHGALSVASDLWLLAIPLSQIRTLPLSWKKRVGATLMFMTGTV